MKILFFALATLALISCNKKEKKSGSTVTPGKSYIMFIGSGMTGYTGSLGGTSGADTKCASDAASRVLTGTYKALISSGGRRACTTSNCGGGISENTDWVLKPNTSYVRLNGTTVIGTTNSSAIFTSLSASIDTSGQAYTGLTTDWQRSSSNCTDFSSSAGGDNSATGLASLTTTGAWANGLSACSGTRGIICVEQ